MDGIGFLDKGIVNAESTWHGKPQYKCIDDRDLTLHGDAKPIADYEIIKRPLFRQTIDGQFEETDAWEIVRTDEDVVLVPHVGSKFTVTSNKFMLSYLDEHLFSQFPDLKIDSVGTLFNGATFFINLRVDEFQVKGDKSQTVTNMMYANPLGRGCAVACCHNTRVVCNNTERIAEAQGLANESLKKFRHTASAAQKISEHMINMAQLKLELKKHNDVLDVLSGQPIDQKELDEFLDFIIPVPEKEGRAKTLATAGREKFMNIFEGSQASTLEDANTKYGLYCAYTDFTDHYNKGASADEAAIQYDSITGGRANKKQTVLNRLLAA